MYRILDIMLDIFKVICLFCLYLKEKETNFEFFCEYLGVYLIRYFLTVKDI